MDILVTSLQDYIAAFSANKAIMLVMVIFMIIGGIDRIRGNKWGYGEKFEEGFYAMGTLAIAIVGMVALVPVIKIVFGNILSTAFNAIGADPSLFAGIFIGMDLGGYPLAMELAATDAIGSFNGVIISSIMGITLLFTIPVGMGIIEDNDRGYLASGILLGFATVPISSICGGLVMIGSGYDLTMRDIIMNTIPVLAVAVLIIIGLVLAQEKMLRGFIVFGKGVTALITIGTIIGTFQYLTGIKLPLFHVMVEPDAAGVVPLLSGIEIVGDIVLVLIGAFPMVAFITKTFSAPLQKLGGKFGLDDVSVAGMIATCANNILMFNMMKDMNTKGKILNCAFTVSACFVIGDHLGFVAGVDQEMIVPMIAAKFAGGFTALILAGFMWKKMLPKEDADRLAA